MQRLRDDARGIDLRELRGVLCRALRLDRDVRFDLPRRQLEPLNARMRRSDSARRPRRICESVE